MKVHLNEGTVVATFSEKDAGHYSYIVRGPVLEFCIDSYPMSLFGHDLQVSCYLLVMKKVLLTF